MADEKGVITFGKEISPEQEKNYKDRIANATNRAKTSVPVGVVERPKIPSLQREASQYASIEDQTPGVQPRPKGSAVLRPETERGLAEAIAAAKNGKEMENIQAVAKGDEKALEEEDVFELFDFGAQSEAEKILNNKKRRREIEERCSPMDLEDLILKDEVQQNVPIVPGKLTATFRSLTPEESLFVKQMMSREEATNNNSNSYLLEKYSLYQLACSLIALNGVALPDHRDQHGSPNKEFFDKKMKTILKKSIYLVVDLGLNYMWFDIRVRKLLNPETLKNG